MVDPSKELCLLQVAHLRKLNKIFIWGDDFPDPLIEFEDLAGCREELINSLHEFGIKEPTPVQMQTIPVMLQRRDVLTSAPTGESFTSAQSQLELRRERPDWTSAAKSWSW